MKFILRTAIILTMTFSILSFPLNTKAINSESVVQANSITYDLSILEDANSFFSLYPDLLTNSNFSYSNGINFQSSSNFKSLSISPLSIVLPDEGGGTCYGSISSFNLEVCVKANYNTVSSEYSRLFNSCFSYLANNAYECSTYAIFNAGMFFAQRVRTGGIWDYKRLYSSYNSIGEVKIGTTYYFLKAEDIGNIHYGYVGSASFSPTILKAFAGLANALDNRITWEWVSTYFDDPVDQLAIQRGINWKKNGYFN